MFMRVVCISLLLTTATGVALAEPDYIAPQALYQADLVKTWQLQLPLDDPQRLRDVHLVDNTAYLATDDGFVFSVDARTGAIRWMRRVTRSGYNVWRPCHAGNLVIFVTPTQLVAYDRYSGDGVRQRQLDFPAGSGAVTDGARIYFGAIDARVYAFDLRFFPVWEIITGGPVTSIPDLYQDRLYFGSDDGHLYACKAPDKSRIWRHIPSTYDRITADIVANDQGIFVASRDRSLYLYEHAFGKVVWRERLGSPLYEAPVVTPDLAFQFSGSDGLVAINTAVRDVDKRVRWTLPNGRALLTIDQQNAYVLGRNERIYVASLKDGDVRHEIPAPGFSLFLPSPENQTLLIAAADGRIFAARPRGAALVTRDDVRRSLVEGPREAAPTTTEQEPAVAAASETEQPLPETGTARDLLESIRKGTVLGGTSKVSKEFNRRQQAGGDED